MTPVLSPQADARFARQALAQSFRQAGLDSPDLDARVLVRHVTGLDPALPGAPAEAPLGAARIAAILALARRRLAREPVARLIGHREFYGRSFALNGSCLVPRPDTETVVEAALACLPAGRASRILDLGTGPGTILLTLLAERPDATGVGIDLSADALAMAKTNAEAFGLSDRVTWRAGSWFAPVDGCFDLIVSNPPYIPAGVCDQLSPEVRDHDPRLALDGGADGLDAYRVLTASAAAHLCPGGAMVLELGIGQDAAVPALARAAGWTVAALDADLGQIPRALTLTRPDCP